MTRMLMLSGCGQIQPLACGVTLCRTRDLRNVDSHSSGQRVTGTGSAAGLCSLSALAMAVSHQIFGPRHGQFRRPAGRRGRHAGSLSCCR
jgi:hypothetical protein